MTNQTDTIKEKIKKFEIEELAVWGHYTESYFLDVLNGDLSLEEARGNLESFRNSEHYTGKDEEFKETKSQKI